MYMFMYMQICIRIRTCCCLCLRSEEMGFDFVAKLFCALGSAWTASVHHLMGQDAAVREVSLFECLGVSNNQGP